MTPPRVTLEAHAVFDGVTSLVVDGADQSHLDRGDPATLHDDYARRIGHLVDGVAARGEPIDAVHLGAGGLTLAHYVAATRPGSHQLAVDIDAELVDLVVRELPPPPGTSLEVGDAFAFVDALPAASADVVIVDLYVGHGDALGAADPAFLASAMRVIRPGGVVAVNVGDEPDGAAMRAVARTLAAIGHEPVTLAPTSLVNGRSDGNAVIAAGTGLSERVARLLALGPHPASVIVGAEF
ncbi:methyltransferase domain-containing protein [Agromyces atrinae]|uniref:spermidine synthase n=1 Tax=Agromyces atrinae TaxID=592376 RepID=UPI001F5A6561|nr:methyltransferase domain-containing protein [Agromyces atrinae]MCI2957785.1 methyltransferase domain-containing protein [Agromyces atrinae]